MVAFAGGNMLFEFYSNTNGKVELIKKIIFEIMKEFLRGYLRTLRQPSPVKNT